MALDFLFFVEKGTSVDACNKKNDVTMIAQAKMCEKANFPGRNLLLCIIWTYPPPTNSVKWQFKYRDP